MLIRHFALLALAACTSPVETGQVEQGLSCEYRRYPCNPLDWSSELECSSVCGYTAHCREYSFRELELCAAHRNQVISLVPYLWCNSWGSPTWDTWCEPTLLSEPPPSHLE